jgi:hypothetical protein
MYYIARNVDDRYRHIVLRCFASGCDRMRFNVIYRRKLKSALYPACELTLFPSNRRRPNRHCNDIVCTRSDGRGSIIRGLCKTHVGPAVVRTPDWNSLWRHGHPSLRVKKHGIPIRFSRTYLRTLNQHIGTLSRTSGQPHASKTTAHRSTVVRGYSRFLFFSVFGDFSGRVETVRKVRQTKTLRSSVVGLSNDSGNCARAFDVDRTNRSGTILRSSRTVVCLPRPPSPCTLFQP